MLDISGEELKEVLFEERFISDMILVEPDCQSSEGPSSDNAEYVKPQQIFHAQLLARSEHETGRNDMKGFRRE